VLSCLKFCQAGKQFSAGTPVICKVCQAGKLFSAVTPVICKVCQAGKRFSAVTQRLTNLQMTRAAAESRLTA
jgi:hypothetical protein